MSRFCRGITDSISKQGFFRSINRLLFQNSHLAPYLPFMKESLSNKIARMYNDQSHEDNIVVEEYHQNTQKPVIRKKHSIQSVFTMSKPCYNPLMVRLMVWYIFVFMAMVYTYVVMGIILTYGEVAASAFHSDPILIAINLLNIFLFIGDIWVQFNTGCIVRGVIITDKRRVVSQYFRTYFIPDVLLIIVLIASMISPSVGLDGLKIIVVIKLFRMFQFDQFYLRKFARKKNYKVIYVIGKQFITIFLLSHTIALPFYLIDYALVNDPACEANNSLCWLYSATAYSPILSYNWQVQYFYTLYWGVNTIATISYGDIAPNNPQETIYALFFFCFGFVVYGYVVNNIIKIILWSRRISDNFKHELIMYTTYMNNLKINMNTQYEIRDYLEYKYLEENERVLAAEEEMKSRLPQDLRDQLLKNAYFKMHNHLEYIFLKSPSIIKLLYYLQQKQYTQNEVILKQGSPLLKLFYLHQGEVSLECLYGRKAHHLTQISKPDSFLSLYQFLLKERATYSITTTKSSTIYVLDWERLDEKIQKYTDLRENFKLTQYQLRINNSFEKIFYSCFYCRANHHWYHCSQYFLTCKNAKFRLLGRAEKKRYYKNLHQTWKDKQKLSIFQKINKDTRFILLQKMKERIYELKKLKESKRSQFDVDACHDWEFFLPNFNFSIFKTAWNDRRRTISRRAHSLQFLVGRQ